MYSLQDQAFFCDARYSFIEGSTKSGKTHGAMVWIYENALHAPHGHNFWWVAPVLAQARIPFERFKLDFMRNGLIDSGFVKVNETNLAFSIQDRGILRFKSSDNPDTLYGDDVYGAVFDEASRATEMAFNAVRSTLTFTGGKLRAVGNVRGRLNWHYKLCRKAELNNNPEYSYTKMTAYDAVAAGVFPQSELDDARELLSEDAFNELYLCIPSDDGGNPFGIEAITKAVRPLSTKPPVCFGADLAKYINWTVIIGLDEDGAVCVFHRFKKNWEQTYEIIDDLAKKFPHAPFVVDASGVGDPVVERLVEYNPMIEGFKFSAQSKQQLMQNLEIGIRKKLVGFPDGIIVTELERMGYELRSHFVIYTSEPGYDTDCVMALGLAYKSFTDNFELGQTSSQWDHFYAF